MQPSANMKPRVRTQSECARDVERGGDLAAGAKLDLITDSNSDQSAVSKGETVAERHAEVIDEFQRSCAGTSLFPIDNNEIGADTRLQNGLADCEEFPGMTDA